MSLHTRFCKVCGVDIDISSDKYLNGKIKKYKNYVWKFKQ